MRTLSVNLGWDIVERAETQVDELVAPLEAECLEAECLEGGEAGQRGKVAVELVAPGEVERLERSEALQIGRKSIQCTRSIECKNPYNSVLRKGMRLVRGVYGRGFGRGRYRR
jgi:hypothetical protein